MFATAKALLLAARLFAATDSTAAETACATESADAHDPSGEDSFHACVCSLETWRCQAQGWCDRDETAPYQEAERPLPVVGQIAPGCAY